MSNNTLIEFMTPYCKGCFDLEMHVLHPWQLRGLNLREVDIFVLPGKLRKDTTVYDLRRACQIYHEKLATPTLRYDGEKIGSSVVRYEKNRRVNWMFPPPRTMKWSDWKKDVNEVIKEIMGRQV